MFHLITLQLEKLSLSYSLLHEYNYLGTIIRLNVMRLFSKALLDWVAIVL